MDNKHMEYTRIAENKKTVCFMVHGIVGTPRYFDRIIPYLPEEWSIYNILLDGHGGSVEDFCNTSMAKWKKQVKEALGKLSEEYEEIIIFAHSMGTLLCMEVAEGYKDKITRMILFAVPLCPFLKPQALCTSLKVIFKKVNEDKETEVNAREQYSVTPDWRIWKYIGFAPRYSELLSLSGKIRKRVGMVRIPATVFMSGKDEMVSRNSYGYLLKNPLFETHCLDNSSHNWFDEKDFEYITQEIKKLWEV